MAKYIKREMADMNGTGQSQAYYKMEITRNVDYHEFIERCIQHGGFQRSTLVGALAHVGRELALTLAQGYSVTIEGLGTFTPRLGVRPDMDQDSFEAGQPSHNAFALRVNGVNYRADKELVSQVDDHCRLERGASSRLRRSPYTEQERIAMACQFFPQKFTAQERSTAATNYVMGLSFITEGAIPFAASDPAHVIPAMMVGSGVAGALSALFKCTLMAPHGGIFVFATVGRWYFYLIALAAGALAGMAMLGLLKKDIVSKEEIDAEKAAKKAAKAKKA